MRMVGGPDASSRCRLHRNLAAAEQEVTFAKDAIAQNPLLFMLVEHPGQIAETKRRVHCVKGS